MTGSQEQDTTSDNFHVQLQRAVFPNSRCTSWLKYNSNKSDNYFYDIYALVASSVRQLAIASCAIALDVFGLLALCSAAI